MDLDNFNNQGWSSPKPSLTEPGVKYFLNETLKQCHIVKNQFHNTVINVGLLIGFLLVLGLILLYKYKGRLTDVEKEKKKQGKTAIYFVKSEKFTRG